MFKQVIVSGLIILTAMMANAQQVRYKDLIFTDVKKTEDLTYADKDKAHEFDLFEPKGDQQTGRPLIIWMHGGGFKFGSKEAKGIQLWCKTFAQRGYVCAAINYTLSKKFPIFNFDELKRSCFYAVQDARQAVLYFKEHAKEYGIDPDKIILAGNSAGGMIALQTAFSTNEELAIFAGVNYTTVDKKEFCKVAGVINLWGGIFNLDWLKNARVPIVNIYGSTDGTVNPTHKDAPLYGAQDVYDRAKQLGVPATVKVFEGYSHELQKHFNPFFGAGKATQKRWLEAGQFAADFLYGELFNQH